MKITIDDKEIEVDPDTTILEAAKKVGIQIPTFCWHEKLDVYGGCRLCLVEVDDLPKLQLACATYVCDGMRIKTNSHKVIKARKGNLEFLLINHPLDCPTCDKAGECELQDYVFKYGSDKKRFKEKKRRFIVDRSQTFDDLKIGPQIIRNQNRCIICARCIRFIKDIAGEDELGDFNRGWKCEINSLPEIPIANQYAGNVVELCPVGALTSKAFRYKIRVWLTKKIESVCPFCGDGCNLFLWVKDNRIYRVTSRRNDKIDEGFLCDRGRFGYDFVNHPDRLRTPLLKKDQGFVPVSWEEAFETIAKRFEKIKKDYGPDFLAGVGSPKLTNEDNYIFQKFFRTVIGTNNIDHRVNIRNPLPGSDFKDYKNFFGMSDSIEDLENSDLIFILGCDMNLEHPIIALRIRKAYRKNGASVILANPKRTKLKNIATYELLYKYGTELAFLNGILNQIIDEKLYRIEENKIRELKDWVKEYDLDKVSDITGVPAEKIKTVAKVISQRKSFIFLLGREIILHHQTPDVVDSINNLILLLGNGRKGSLNLLWEYNNSCGALDMSVLPDRLPGYLPVNDLESKKRFENFWKEKLSEKPGKSFNKMLEAILQGSLKAMYIMGSDPVREFPDRNFALLALKKLDFLVVQDIFLTETAKIADVVLPGASFAEKDGTFTNCERRVQKLKRGFKPIYDSKADWEIICELANYWGSDFDYPQAKDITSEIAEVVPIYSGFKCKQIDENGKRLDLSFEKEKVRFKRADYKKIPDDKEYPFVLITGNIYHHFGTLTQKGENLNSIVSEGFCEINPEDAKSLDIFDENLIKLESLSGKIEIKAKLKGNIQKGTVFVPINFEKIRYNLLMDKDKLVDRVRIRKS